MGPRPHGTVSVFLRLARISNLPTVWTNILAGVALSHGRLDLALLLALLASASLFYMGGMFLNDAFDAPWDRSFRPERPIPSGQVSRSKVYVAGFCFLALAEVFLVVPLLVAGRAAGVAAVFGLLLGLLIVLYDAWHKGNPVAPLLIGTCRALLYLIAGAASALTWTRELLEGSCVLILYVAGVAWLARGETVGGALRLWPLALLGPALLYPFARIPSALLLWGLFLLLSAGILYAFAPAVKEGRIGPATIAGLIAAISLLDALFIASAGGNSLWIAAALGGFLFTVFLQRYVPGT